MGNQRSSTAPGSVSATGQYEVFTSGATDLVNGATIQSGAHVYLRNLISGTTTLVDVDVNNANESGNRGAVSNSAVITPDGRYVAFESYATDLTNNDANALGQIYVRDMQTGETYLVSLGTDGKPGNSAAGLNGSGSLSIAKDGQDHLLIAYQSHATNLTQGNSSSKQQIFLAALNLDSSGNIQYSSLSTALVSADNSGTGNGGNYDSSNPLLSEDGSTLAFSSRASNLNVPGGYSDNNYPVNVNLYLYSVAGQTLKLLSAEPTTGTDATGNKPSTVAYDAGNMPSAVPQGVSANGQYTVFTSASDNLVPGLNIGIVTENVYRRDLVNGTTSLVSINDTGTGVVGSAAFANQGVMTPDGRYVAFVSDSKYLTANANTGITQVFVRDMQQGKTYLVTLGTDGKPQNHGYGGTVGGTPSIAETSDGRLVVAYVSTATNLTSGDSNSTNPQTFVTTFQLDSNGDIEYNTLMTKLASADSSGNGANDDSKSPFLSKDGSALAFLSRATNLPGEGVDAANGINHWQLFAYAVASGTLTQVSPTPSSGTTSDVQSPDKALNLTISDNGQYIAYQNNSSDGTDQILVWRNKNTGKNTLIAEGGVGQPFSGLVTPVLSGDGSTVAFAGSTSSTPNRNIYVVKNWQSGGSMTEITGNPNNVGSEIAQDPMLSDNGQVLAYGWDKGGSSGNGTNLYVTDLKNGTTQEGGVLGGGGPQDLVLPVSSDGSTVVFNSAASDLVPGITNFVVGQDNVFAYNVASNNTSLVSAKAPGLFAADAGNVGLSPSLSDNGRYVAFSSPANDQLGNLFAHSNVFAEDVQQGVPTLLSVNSSGADDKFGLNQEPIISGDGSIVAFQSDSADLIANQTINGSQIYSRDWQASTPKTTLVSVNSAGTAGGNKGSENPSISDDGQVIAFDSTATDLTGNDANAKGYTQIFLRNLGKSTTTLASCNSAATDGGNNNSSTAFLSNDGKTVIYNSSATDLVSGVSVPNDSNGNPIVPNVYAYGTPSAQSAPKVTTNPTDQTVTAGQTATFTASATGNPDPKVQWQVSTDGGKTFSDINGATNTKLTLSNTKPSQNGNEYRAVFTNGIGTAATTAATLIVEYAPIVTTDPSSQTVVAGKNATFMTAANANPAATVQWQVSTDDGKNFSNINGSTTTTLTLTGVTAAMNGYEYQAVFSNSIGTTTTTAATLTVNYAPVVTTNPGNQTVNAGQNATFTAAADANPAATVQWQVSRDGGKTFNNISDATSATLTLNNVTTDMNSYEYQAVFSNSIGSSTSAPATLTVTNIPSAPAITADPNSQTVTAGKTATFKASASGNPTPAVKWQVSTDGGKTFSDISGATSTTLTLTNVTAVMNGNEYEAIFTNSVGTATTKAATLTVDYAPTVTTNPSNLTVGAGKNATFTAAADANPAATVQWQVSTDGGKTFTNISGATSTTLTLNNVQASQSGNEYQAVFSNSVGTATTAAASLTLGTAPAITSGNSATFTVGQSGSFTVTATGTPTPTLTESGALPKGVTFTVNGNGTATLGGTPAAGTKGKYHFTITAHNAAGSVTQSFTLKVKKGHGSRHPHNQPPLTEPPLLKFVYGLLKRLGWSETETVNANGTVTETARFFSIPVLVSTFDSSGKLESVTWFGINVTLLFELL